MSVACIYLLLLIDLFILALWLETHPHQNMGRIGKCGLEVLLLILKRERGLCNGVYK